MEAMTRIDTTARRTRLLLPGAHRVVRRLHGGEGPFAGTLVTDGESMSVLRDAEGLADWGGWPFAGTRHVAAPVDVVRRADGHDVLLPWCTERVAVFLGRREGAGSPLSTGEVSTLAVSLLRGIGELGVDPPGDRRGEWWLTDEGCPVLVLGEENDARVAAATLLEAISMGSSDRLQRRLLDGIAEGLRRYADRPDIPPRQLDIWESELLATASPRPLLSMVEEPGVETGAGSLRRRVAATASPRVPSSASSRGAVVAPRAVSRSDRPSRARRGLRRPSSAVSPAFLDRGVERVRVAFGRLSIARRRGAQLVARSGDEHHARSGSSPRTRRRVPKVAVGIAAAGAVLAAGLLWPSDPGSDPVRGEDGARETSHDADREARRESADEPAEHTEAIGPGAAAPDRGVGAADSSGTEGIEGAASTLVASIRECAATGDAVCASAVVSGASHVVALFKGAPSGEDRTRLVDEYGGAAVVRLSHEPGGAGLSEADDDAVPGGGDRMLVLVRVDEKWLVRDAYDVADQPG